MTASPSPPSTGGTVGSGAGKGAPAADAASTAPAGAFAKRFPRLSASFQKYSSTRIGRVTSTAWTRRRPILFGLAITYGFVNYAVVRRDAYLRDFIHPDSWLVLKVYPGSIVECKSTPNLVALLSSPSAGEDRAVTLELFEVCRALKWAMRDERIRGIFADFSGLHVPSSVAPEPLGMAQLEELVESIHEFKIAKREQFYLNQHSVDEEEASNNGDLMALSEGAADVAGKELSGGAGEKVPSEEEKQVAVSKGGNQAAPVAPTTTIAWADSFDSQGSYLLASAFDEVYLQPSGAVPLTGLTMQIPFVERALGWLGVKVHAEARREYKSMISTFTQRDGLPPAQLQDAARLLGELSRGLAHAIGVNRFGDMDPEEAADRVSALTRRGPFSAKDALKEGLITGIKYKSEVIKELGEEPQLRSLASYSRITDRILDRKLSEDERSDVAVIYLRGTISNAPGEFSASSVIRGLKEAGEDEDISSIVLRIDSGGGDVVASDSIWDAVRRVQEDFKKPVVASFGNTSASGGYYASACADAIVACESTVTGSIGVASLRPTITKKLFDRLGIQLQTIFTGSKTNSSIHEMEPEEMEKHSLHIDETYDTFLDKVCKGRKISRDVIEELAGGRVWTGLAAWVRCNPDKELVKDEEVGSEAPGGKDSKQLKDRKAGASDSSVPVKVISLAGDWKTTDVTKESEMSTIRIQALPALPHSDKVSAAEDDDEEALRQEILAEFSSGQKEDEERSLKGRGVVARSVLEERGEDEEATLAAAAHEEAEASHHQNSKEAVLEESEENLGPYGRGLVDSIGGIWDASYLAFTIALQKEIEALVKGGMTLEQATSSIRPGCQREIGPDGTLSLATDLRLVKYPKEKSFRERVRELNRKGDQPSLGLLPGFGNVAAQMRDFFTDVAVQVLMRSWSDPALIQRMLSEVERERGMRMEYNPSMRI